MADEEKKPTDGEPASEKSPQRKPLNRKPALTIGAVVACVLAVIAILWWLHARNYESTDDAFIDAHVVQIAPRIAGQVARVLVRDNQLVAAGDRLVEIDRADPESRLGQVTSQRVEAQTQLAQATAQFLASEAGYAGALANASAARAQAGKALRDLERYQSLHRANPKAVSQTQLDQIVTATGAGVRLYSKSNPLAGLTGGGGAPASADSSTNLHVYALALDASWEIDLFGGVRSAVEAARANTEAQVWQLRDGEVSLSAEVANDYLTLRALQARRAVIAASIDHEAELLQLATARQSAGLANEVDVNQERTQLARDQAQLPQLEAQAGATTNALAVLLGETPETMQDELAALPATTDTTPEIGQVLPAGMPSDLLRRRPDVRLAERRLAAATDQVGVAVAKLYPSFDLIAAASFASSSLQNLLSVRNFAALGIGDVMWPVFDGGRVRANVRATEEERAQAYLAYQGAVLAALQDAENAIIRCTTEERRLELLQSYVSAASSTAHIAADEYRNGIVDFTTVLGAADAELDARDALVQSRQALAQARIALYKALGGGWRESNTADGAPAKL